jgi:hypothetical protein
VHSKQAFDIPWRPTPCTTHTELTNIAHIFILVLCWAAQEEAAQRCDALGEPVPNAATIAAAHHDKYLTATATAPVARAALVFAAVAHSESGMPHKTIANFKRIVRPAVRTALQVSVERFERWRAEAA